MSEKISINQLKKIKISSEDCMRSVEIGDCAIDHGFLHQFPGASLAIFLYLVTHINDKNTMETNPTIISSFLPDDYSPDSVKKGLKHLEKHDIIKISSHRRGDYTYKIELNLNKIGKNLYRHSKGSSPGKNNNKEIKNTYFNRQNIRREILEIKSPTRADLFKAILTFIPPGQNPGCKESCINQWLEDFDTRMIRELIRRVDKWINKYDNPPEIAFQYLQGIVDDWYQKEIHDYQRLQYFDKLYRETRELAAAYGLKDWHNLKPAHMKTFKKWLTEGFSLSIDVVKLAIQEAIKRKKDGQPSLQYIENNFIKPWKKARVRTAGQARKLLGKNGKKRKSAGQDKRLKTKGKNLDNWNNLCWDFEKEDVNGN